MALYWFHTFQQTQAYYKDPLCSILLVNWHPENHKQMPLSYRHVLFIQQRSKPLLSINDLISRSGFVTFDVRFNFCDFTFPSNWSTQGQDPFRD